MHLQSFSIVVFERTKEIKGFEMEQAIGEADDSRYCPHCDEKVSRTTFYRHRAKFFNHLNNTWRLPSITDTAAVLRREETEDCSQESQAQYSGRTRKYTL